MLRVLDLFSGIGGFSLGLERTGGFETVAFAEIDPFCQKVLKKHWPGVPVYSDVRMLRGYMLPTIDIITGGYPCQPFSYAGKRGGEKDNRHLWPQMFRLIQECRPGWVFAENVAGHITMGLDEVLSDLESENYTSQTFVIPACATDAPHRRDRVWIVANSAQLHSDGQRDYARESKGQIPQLGNGPCTGDVAHSHSHMPQGSKNPRSSERNRPRVEQYALGCDADSNQWREWLPEPDVGRVAHGVPARVDRLRGLGNAVVPQIPEIIGNAILQAEAAN